MAGVEPKLDNVIPLFPDRIAEPEPDSPEARLQAEQDRLVGKLVRQIIEYCLGVRGVSV